MNHPGGSIIHDPDWRACLIGAFLCNERARLIWARQAAHPDRLPDLFVACSDGASDLAGLVIGGKRDPEDENDWDTDGSFLMFDETGVVLTVNGWVATDIEAVHFGAPAQEI